MLYAGLLSVGPGPSRRVFLPRAPRPKAVCVICLNSGLDLPRHADFHAGLLLASTIPSPTLFIVRNDGFAISTPSTEQFYGDGIAGLWH
jgi:2-oxoisovalerate dehydrogenase E1 component alpha subunit